MAAGSTGSIKINDEMIEEARSFIGCELRIEQYNHEATYDAIRHYAYGIGDDNPLWCDEEYARSGPFGTMVGPPTFFLSVFPPTVSPGFPGIPSFHAGGDYRWNRLPRLGEKIFASARLTDVVERHGRTVDRLFIQESETTYSTGDGEVLAVFGARSFRTPPPALAGSSQYKARFAREYSMSELESIAEDVFAEEVRGGEPRYWEDVSVGDTITPVVKGPLDQISMMCYYAGAMPGVAYRPVDLAWKQRRAVQNNRESLPNNFLLPPSIFGLTRSGQGHHDEDAAHSVGMPGRYDNGHMRIGWTSHLITNWMGDSGKLKRLCTEIRRPNLLGNTTWFQGTVLSKRVDEDGDRIVEIELLAEDQDGLTNTKGAAWVALPTKTGNHGFG